MQAIHYRSVYTSAYDFAEQYSSVNEHAQRHAWVILPSPTVTMRLGNLTGEFRSRIITRGKPESAAGAGAVRRGAAQLQVVAHARHCLDGHCRHHRRHRPFRDKLVDLFGQDISSLLRVLYRMHVILEDNPLRRMIEAQSCQPVSVCPRPRFATVQLTVPQQKTEQLLTCPAQATHRANRARTRSRIAS